MLKLWLRGLVPRAIEQYLDRRRDAKAVAAIKKLTAAQINTLTAREQLVANRINIDVSYRDIANEMNVTRERVRQIHAKIIRKIQRRQDDPI
jgi:DNA-directed RNA polymerase sigma subunit (sigma70/sigma32)